MYTKLFTAVVKVVELWDGQHRSEGAAGIFAADCSSSSSFARLDGLLIHLEVDVASVPDGDSLYEDTLLLPALNIADDIEPCPHVYVEFLNSLEHMFDIEIRDDGRIRYRIVVLEPQCRGLSDVLIDAAAQSVSVAAMAYTPCTSPESGLWCPAHIRASHLTTPDSKQRDQTLCLEERAQNAVETRAAAEVHGCTCHG